MPLLLSVFSSDWGWVGLAVSDRGLAGVVLPKPSKEAVWAELRTGWPGAVPAESDPWPELKQRLLDYLAGKPSDFSDIPLDLPEGPGFRRRVWEICARTPYGETRSYADLAREAGSPRAFRAVGGAMAANPIPIVIPCHRVLGSNGSLTGFGGGLAQKRRLLEMESRATPLLLLRPSPAEPRYASNRPASGTGSPPAPHPSGKSPRTPRR